MPTQDIFMPVAKSSPRPPCPCTSTIQPPTFYDSHSKQLTSIAHVEHFIIFGHVEHNRAQHIFTLSSTSINMADTNLQEF
jgi:hypothetical protein